MACLEKFRSTDYNSVDKPIALRLTMPDQQEVPNSTAQELYRGMAGSLVYLRVLLRGLVLTLPLRSLSCRVLSLILANHTWKQPNACSDTSRRL